MFLAANTTGAENNDCYQDGQYNRPVFRIAKIASCFVKQARAVDHGSEGICVSLIHGLDRQSMQGSDQSARPKDLSEVPREAWKDGQSVVPGATLGLCLVKQTLTVLACCIETSSMLLGFFAGNGFVEVHYAAFPGGHHKQ
jgi:hypothetical protein